MTSLAFPKDIERVREREMSLVSLLVVIAGRAYSNITPHAYAHTHIHTNTHMQKQKPKSHSVCVDRL